MERIRPHQRDTTYIPIPTVREYLEQGKVGGAKRRDTDAKRLADAKKLRRGDPIVIVWHMVDGPQRKQPAVFVQLVKWSADKSVVIAIVVMPDGSKRRVDAMRVRRA
jgi:hypothetical protein